MKVIQSLLLAIALSFNTILAQESPVIDGPPSEQYSNLELARIQVVPIKESRTGRQYELYIKLPEKYSENADSKHPVIYFTDAMWHVEILSGSAEYVVENAILVGISWQKDISEDLINEMGPHVSRFRDYTMTEHTNSEYQQKYHFGQAANHLDFIRVDVISFVESNYRTDPDNRTYFGYSVGGAFGTYILFVEPKTFKHYILGSPTTLFDDSFIYEHEMISSQKRKDLEANIFVSVGALEEEDMVSQANGLVSTLNKDYTTLSSKLTVIEAADHGQAFPMTAVRSMYWLAELIK